MLLRHTKAFKKKKSTKQSDATNIILIPMYNEHKVADGAHQTCP